MVAPGAAPPGAHDRVLQRLATEPDPDRTVFLARLDRHWPDLVAGLRLPYGDRAEALAGRCLALAVEAFRRRPADLRLLDLRRHVEPDWFQSPRMLGYAAYADRFAGTLRGVADRVPYLRELGVTYLHLLPLLRPRPGPDDGGYAVQDYRTVREDLGSVADLVELARVLRGQGISLVLDLVLNHVAAEHEWARRARAGEQRYRRYFHLFPDRTEPDAFEASLPEVFPDSAPGSFSWDESAQAWVWTTFHAWQWDLNWTNPDVFCELLDVVLFLANLGVEVVRLDAIAFLWKRLGTDCQNQPEVHAITQALRAAARIAAPALLFKAEAIVGPGQLVPYLGVGAQAGKVSDLAYHNSLMVQVWSSLAARDARLMTTALRRFPPRPASTAWGTYLRCHDDIGWAVSDEDAAAVGWDGAAHRRFLSDWYSGAFPGSDARGLVFQENPATGDRRISGSAAALAGLQAALERGDPAGVDLAIGRLLVAHAVVLAYGGVPLVWMGDELALRNDEGWVDEPAHADDNRWAHRPPMRWDVAARRHQVGTVEHRMWTGLRRLITARSEQPAMHASVEPELLDPADPGVLGFVRRVPSAALVALHNMTDDHRTWPVRALGIAPTAPSGGAGPDTAPAGGLRDVLTGRPPDLAGGALQLPPYAAVWLVPVSG